MVLYGITTECGLDSVRSLGDGSTIAVKWFQAFAETYGYSIAYYIYYSTEPENAFADGIKYISIDDSLEANIINLDPGRLLSLSPYQALDESKIFLF
ncbi:MAG: hypothetical protein WCG08_16375 [Paludibacter sp.]